MSSSMWWESLAAQAVPPPSSIRSASARARPSARPSLSRFRTAARSASGDFASLAYAVSSPRSAAASIISSSLSEILAISCRCNNVGAVYSVICRRCLRARGGSHGPGRTSLTATACVSAPPKAPSAGRASPAPRGASVHRA